MSNIRNTVQRTLVLDAVNKMKFHPNAEDIYTEIIKTYPNISKATVYRNLNLLAESNEIRRVKISDGADCFDYKCSKHYHAKCSKCGKVIDIEMEKIKDLDKQIKNNHNFNFDGHDIIFNGICSDCKK